MIDKVRELLRQHPHRATYLYISGDLLESMSNYERHIIQHVEGLKIIRVIEHNFIQVG